MAIKRPLLAALAFVLLGFCHRGCWGIYIGLSTCLDLQLDSVLLNCILEDDSDEDTDQWKECLVTMGVDACLQCVNAHIQEVMQDYGYASAFEFQTQMMFSSVAEGVISILLQSAADCLDYDKDVVVDCAFNLAIERLMVPITKIIEDNFQHPEYVSCWARGTLNEAKECVDLIPDEPRLMFGVRSSYQPREHKEFTLCLLRSIINSASDC